ncbi:Bug family tripartite tricarboxylate transporter substrate binding protein [[Micrococcus luteus] ATCC 49442]|uniref:Bug family tripartite tricarboxylate transporter substrate binding protein n=1 Tax=[Micrococcus luteus] ATCC 49442 TaxID=2698727 RepID=UPI0013DB7014|nr:tripartite tricarboxylate transporter substrate-binding protein [[Micrococcus luteus] ATCC 49442]
MRHISLARRLSIGALATSATLAIAGCGGASGNPQSGPSAEGCESLEGKTISVVVPFAPGGGYDSYARLIAPNLGKALNAQVIVKNQPGAGGLVAINSLVHAKGDGTQIAIMNGAGVAAAVLAEAEGAGFSLDDLSYIGRVGENNTVLVTGAESKYETWDDVKASEGFRFGSSGRGSSDFITPSILMEAFDLKNAQIVTGFGGQSEVELALLQGNVDGLAGPADSRRAGIASGEQTPLLSIASERVPEAPETPVFSELDLTERQEMLLTAHQTVNELGRPLVGPANMDPAALECLRDALGTIASDENLLAEGEKQFRPISYVPGKDLEEQVINKIKKLPEEYLSVLKKSF